jgi:arylsulfatase A-like enzyme
VVNRQTIAVTIGTLVLVVLGALLLYTGPEQGTANKPSPGQAVPAKAAKGEKANKAKGQQTPKRLPDAELVHSRAIPADRKAAPEGAPNVVLVMMSTQRRDQWSVYGGPPTTTPFLAQAAAQGVKMMDALAVAADPKPAAAAIITGRYPHHVGGIEPSEKKNTRPLVEEAETLAERFAAAGWHTVGLSANHFLNEKVGGAQGFDWYRDSQPFSLMLEQRITASELVEATLEQLGKRGEAEKARPLYLQLAFVDSHKPIKIPPAEFEPFGGENGEVAPYRATLKRQDDAVRALVDGLAAQGLTPENTLFVVLADHGEGLDMPVHHRKQHGFVLYRSVVQIPWILWGEGVPKAQTVDGLASQLDLAPTVLSLAGVAGQTGFDGQDLSVAVLGRGKSPRDKAYADTHYEGVHRASVWTSARACQKDFGTTKEIEGDQFADACYDRKADPDFTKAIEDPQLTGELESLYKTLMEAAKG